MLKRLFYKVDLNGNICFWTGLCDFKTCAHASFEYNSNLKSKTYLNTYTIGNSDRGLTQFNQLIKSTSYIGGCFEGARYDQACFTAPYIPDLTQMMNLIYILQKQWRLYSIELMHYLKCLYSTWFNECTNDGSTGLMRART